VLGMWLFVSLLCAPVHSAQAQARAARALRAVEIERTGAGWILDLKFEFAIRYIRHSPPGPARSLRIWVDPIAFEVDVAIQGPIRENLPIPRGEPIPLLEIVYDSSLPEEPVVEIQFSQSLEFHVEQSSRGLRIRAEVPSESTSSGSNTANTANTANTRATQLLLRARHSIRDGDLDLAIALLTRVLELPEDESDQQSRMDARELVGLTYERRGQLAHAQAEYEAYLEDYPDGPAANRVRQRLESLVTASSAPRKPLRRPNKSIASEDSGSAITRDLFGSVSGRYFRSESLPEDSGGEFLATDVLFDFDVAGTLESEAWSLRGDFTGTYDIDVAGEGRSDDARVSRLSIHAEDRVHRIEATFGRQRRSDSGVQGRFDGLHVAAEFGSHLSVSGLIGLPVESTSDSKPNTDSILAAGAIDFEELWIPGLQGQFFAVGQNTASLTDRAAIGGELRYSGEKSYSFVYLDYDVAFQSLNTFLASTSYRLSPDTDFRLLVERRNSPILTLQTALQGQAVDDLDSLKRIFSESEIRDLAEDRTAVSWSGTVGATHSPNRRYQFSTDLTVSHFGKTESSGAIIGSEAFGPDVSTSVQVVVNDWLVDGGIGSVSLRYFNGETFDSWTTTAYSRFSLPHRIRLLPRIRWDWRDSLSQGESSTLRPSIEVDWRHESFLIDLEAGIAWEEPISNDVVSREISYFLELGIRWEF